MTRLDLIAARATRTHQPQRRRTGRQPGDGVGKVATGPGIDAATAIELAKLEPWWPRRRTDMPTWASGWWCWPLRPGGVR